MQRPIPLTRDLVLIGGGHAHALVLRMWGMAPLPGVRLTLVDPQPVTAYTGMLPGFVAGHYPRPALDIDLVRLARFAGARILLGAAEGLDPGAGTLEVAGHDRIAFDVASLDIGVSAALDDLAGFAAHGVPVRPLATFAGRWTDWLARVDGGQASPEIAVLGAGVGGVELALAMKHRCPGARIEVIETAEPLNGISGAARSALLGHLERAGIALRLGSAQRIEAGEVVLEDGTQVPSSFTVAAAGARPQPWLRGTGLALTNGFVDVGADLRSSSHEGVFAVGDCASFTPSPLPRAGVFAVRQAPVLLRNLRAALGAGRPADYRPQRDYLKLISLGGKAALADRSGLSIAGGWLWTLKNRIDLRFMARLSELPAMPGPALPAEVAAGVREVLGDGQPVCGGCGAKVGAAALDAALAPLAGPSRADVEPLPGDDAAALVFGEMRQVISTDHLRGFAMDPALVARVAAVHALGDVHAMGAAPQAALASVVLPPMSARLQERWLREIMTAARDVFGAAGAQIVGGHTTEGAELTIGFTVTGLRRGSVIALSGARPGDRIILTKPIGSGTIMAAEMAMRAPGRVVAAAWDAMCHDQGAAARALAGASAMTDVTGFGLAGHLLNVCRASGVGAEVALADIPLMAGAGDLAAAGVRSSLYPGNRAASEPLVAGLTEGPAAALIFDPQTAGGLLAALPEALAEAALKAVRAEGYGAAIIGRVSDAPPGIRLV